MSLIEELKRRNVFRVGIAYLVLAWVLLQVTDVVVPILVLPDWVAKLVLLLLALGFPVVLIFAWAFELTPEGIKREKDVDRSQSITRRTGRKLDFTIIAILVIALGYFAWDKFARNNSPVIPANAGIQAEGGETTSVDVADSTGQAAEPQEKSIAVLPFVALSSGPDDGYFADGLTEEILNSLAQLPELLVTSRTSAFHFKGQDIPLREIAAQLGVAHIVEGSVRRSGDRLRVTAQLIRASDGFHVWSENYDSTSADTIAVQENIAEQIATAMDVVLDTDKREAMRRSGLRDVEAFIAMQKGLEIYEKAHGDPDLIGLLRQANAYFEIVQERVPAYPLAYQAHSDLYNHQLMNGAGRELGGVRDAREVAEAMERARADGEAFVSYARTPQERHNAEMDLAFVTGDWRGMTARIERFAGERGCDGSNWYDNFTLPFGYASKVLHRAEEFTLCDPLSSGAWRSRVRAELWAGNPETALNIGQQGAERAPGEWLSLQLISAQVALGQFEQAEAEIAARLQLEADIRSARLLVAAARGDRATVGRLLEQFYLDPNASDFWALVYSGWMGDRETANEIAARIDSHVFGSPALSTILLWCLCGAPWDLSAAPNFDAVLKESGLPWPPASPIDFPLKNW